MKTWMYVITVQSSDGSIKTATGLKKFDCGAQQIHMYDAVHSYVCERYNLHPEAAVLFYRLEPNS